jgi:hypothetical protein
MREDERIVEWEKDSSGACEVMKILWGKYVDDGAIHTHRKLLRTHWLQ